MNQAHPIARTLGSVLLISALAACGGGGSAGSASGSLTVTAANPGSHNTTLDLSRATTSGNNTRAADGFSAAPYCEVFYEGFTGANGITYALQVYFRQSDKAVLHASLVGGAGVPSWAVFHNNAGSPITGVTVDTATRSLSFNAKVLNGSSGETATLNGSASFPANSGTPACGA